MPAPQIIISPEASTPQLAEAVIELQRILTRGIGFGDPADGTVLARKTSPTPTRPNTRIGRTDNVFGSLVEVTLAIPGDLNTNIVCQHSLNLPAPASRVGRNQRLNVRWLVAGARYQNDNYAANLLGVGNSFSVIYADGVVDANSIGLRFYTTLSSLGNPELQVTLLFIPASG